MTSTDLDYADLVKELEGTRKPSLKCRKNSMRKWVFKSAIALQRRTFFQLVRKISRGKQSLCSKAKEIINGTSSGESAFPSKASVEEHFLDLYKARGEGRQQPSGYPKRQITVGFNESPITIKEVRRQLRSSNSKSAPGLDNVTYEAMTKKFTSIGPRLVSLYNNILQTGEPPGANTAWCTSIVTLLHKKGDPTDAKNYRPIAVTSSITRLFHRILAARLEKYIRSNSIININHQKGFIRGLHGALEHSHVVDCLIRQAQKDKTELYVTFFDLENAFGSIEDKLVGQTLSHIQLPGNVLKYLLNFYSQISGILKGPFGKVHVPFKRGVFQGDPLSPLIFNLVIEPLLETLSHPDSLACAYADDSNLVTLDGEVHFQITERFNSKADDMLLKIRPDKCISFAIRQGEVIPFRNVVNGVETGSLLDHGHLSYLGKLFCKDGDAETSEMILSKIQSGLAKIGKANVSRKAKVKIALDYLLPSCYHDLMINDMTQSSLVSLDRMFAGALITWAYGVELLPHHIPSYVYQWLQTLKVYFLITADDLVLESTLSKYADSPYLGLAFRALGYTHPKAFIRTSIFGKIGHRVAEPSTFPVSSRTLTVDDVGLV